MSVYDDYCHIYQKHLRSKNSIRLAQIWWPLCVSVIWHGHGDCVSWIYIVHYHHLSKFRPHMLCLQLSLPLTAATRLYLAGAPFIYERSEFQGLHSRQSPIAPMSAVLSALLVRTYSILEFIWVHGIRLHPPAHPEQVMNMTAARLLSLGQHAISIKRLVLPVMNVLII